jgi:hypothetical protein
VRMSPNTSCACKSSTGRTPRPPRMDWRPWPG